MEIYHSLIEPDSLRVWLYQRYDLTNILRCRLIRMGLNDTYELQCASKSYIVRLYRAHWRSKSAISAELESILWLTAKDFPCAAPMMAKDKHFIQYFTAPEGERAIVVFDYIEGQALTLDAMTAAAYGQALATLHTLTADFHFSHARFALDQQHLIDEPLHHITRAFNHHPVAIQTLKQHAALAKNILNTLPKIAPFYGFCHGDHFGNVLKTPQNTLSFIDFDCCGMGFRTYDIVQFYWALRLRIPAWQETFLTDNATFWSAFLSGYEKLRPLHPLERQTMPAMFIARTLWGLGLQPQNERHWGIENHERIWQQNIALLDDLTLFDADIFFKG